MLRVAVFPLSCSVFVDFVHSQPTQHSKPPSTQHTETQISCIKYRKLEIPLRAFRITYARPQDIKKAASIVNECGKFESYWKWHVVASTTIDRTVIWWMKNTDLKGKLLRHRVWYLNFMRIAIEKRKKYISGTSIKSSQQRLRVYADYPIYFGFLFLLCAFNWNFIHLTVFIIYVSVEMKRKIFKRHLQCDQPWFWAST